MADRFRIKSKREVMDKKVFLGRDLGLSRQAVMNNALTGKKNKTNKEEKR